MTQTAITEVRCVLIPLMTSRLLLPNAVVAEVMDFCQPVPRENMPDWFLGDLVWRGTTLPMVSIEGMIGGRGTVYGQHCRTLVLNTLNGNRALTHIAIIAQAIPTLIRVSIENLEPSKLKGDLGSLIRLSVNLHSGLALIPDLDELERQIFKVIEQPSG